jgi:acyl carrier protein
MASSVSAQQTRTLWMENEDKVDRAAGMSIRETIFSYMRQVAREQQVTLPPLHDALVLLDSGLDSLCFAVLVTRLEDELGLEPFTSAEEAYFPVTLGDFVRVYEDAAASEAAA